MGDLVKMSVAMVCSTISDVMCGTTCFAPFRHFIPILAILGFSGFASCLPMSVSYVRFLPV